MDQQSTEFKKNSKGTQWPLFILFAVLPGSGKAPLASRLETELRAVCLSPEEWLCRTKQGGHKKGKRKLVEGLQWKTALKILSAGTDVNLENGFWYREERLKLRAEAQALGAQTNLHFLDGPTDELKRRITNRNLSPSADQCYVNSDHVDDWVHEFEGPTSEELQFRR